MVGSFLQCLSEHVSIVKNESLSLFEGCFMNCVLSALSGQQKVLFVEESASPSLHQVPLLRCF